MTTYIVRVPSQRDVPGSVTFTEVKFTIKGKVNITALQKHVNYIGLE